ncbi:MAG: CPBP family intramembrane metalloprotease, partial [Clostridiales bacterium]|nr:CPBP family intramembrane metalloprotease [Clostridiales bacterium]
AAVLMVGMYLPTVWYGYFTRVIGVPENTGDIDLGTASSIVMIVIASVALAPIMEETIYRGVLLHGLNREKPVVTSVMLTALAFTLMHMNVVQIVFQFALGVLSGFIAIKTKRLLPSILLHASANAFALIMQLTPLAGVLSSCEAWLTQNVAAAVFITLGLFAAGFGVLFVLVRYGFELKQTFARLFKKKTVAAHVEKAGETEEAVEEAVEEANAVSEKSSDDETANRVAEIRRVSSRSDGTFKYYIGLGICVVMLIVNLVTVILS